MALHFTSLQDPELITLLNSGAIGVVPTDTVYGLVAKATHVGAVRRMYGVKSRPRQPGTTIGATTQQLESLGFPASSLTAATPYWPDAISVEMPATSIPEYLSTGQPVMAARIPRHPQLATLLQQTGPLMTTSANAPGELTSTSVQMAMDYFGDDIDFYVDGGDLSGRPPSTIIGFDDNHEVIVYRQGAVKISSS